MTTQTPVPIRLDALVSTKSRVVPEGSSITLGTRTELGIIKTNSSITTGFWISPGLAASKHT
jgi:hypothetical protein